METPIQKTVDVYQIRNLLSKANSIDEIKDISSFFPELSNEEKMIAHDNLNDGIYDTNGTLIGEKHPED